MIPKVIHYCWFGGKPLTDLAMKCIESWKKYCPDYEIRLWNEENFDLHACAYVSEAYEKKKWAFVSDYARFVILYEHGGIYFDTDVELIKPIDDIIANGAFMGCELDSKNSYGYGIRVAPGLGMAAPAGMSIYKTIIEEYHKRHFLLEGGSEDLTTVVEFTTDILKKVGLQESQEIQEVTGIHIYPKEFFNPYDFETGELHFTENTFSAHHYAASWSSKRSRVNKQIYYVIQKIIRFIRGKGL